MAIDVTTAAFEQDVLERSHDVPVVVDFWAEWCGPCRTLGPVLEEETAARGDEVVLVKVDVDANQELAQRYGIQGIPAVKAFRNGQVVKEFVGALPKPAVAAFLDELTGPGPGERLLAELRESGELPEVAAAIEAGEHERALELLLAEVEGADADRRGDLRDLTVLLFAELGDEHELTMRYRRRLAALLY